MVELILNKLKWQLKERREKYKDMKIFYKLTIIFFLFLIFSCGKKSSLDRYPESDYPRDYPSNNE